ncbi:MAG: hypothetical protein ABIP22_10390 [Ginsengibacter sp.]
MQQIIKKFQPLLWISVVMLTMMLAYGCSGDTAKTEEPATIDTTPATVAPDSLPKLDSSAKQRPEGIKTVTQ